MKSTGLGATLFSVVWSIHFSEHSYSNGDLIYISQTASSLDELSGCIDPVPFENSSTVGITASSELVAHRSTLRPPDVVLILHGHPRFAVVMSMLCEEEERLSCYGLLEGLPQSEIL